MNHKRINKGFVIAGLSNILGVVILSKMFTNEVMMNAQPEVMGYFGLISIILWGLAYIAVRHNYSNVPWLIAVFVVEKLIYVIMWLQWQSANSLANIYNEDTFAGIFYTIYGINDFIFMLFFGWVLYTIKKT